MKPAAILTKPCEVCGTEFQKRPTISKARWAETRFCSRSCFGKSQGEKNRTLPYRTCPTCMTEFRPSSFGTKYCSTECAKGRFVGRQGAGANYWKGGRTKSSGYWRVHVPREHPMAEVFEPFLTANRYMLEHRLVMAESLGRPLRDDETVHHINGDRLDNRLENLQLRQGRHGKGAQFVCLDCGSHNVGAAQI